MDRIEAEVDRTCGAGEVVNPEAALGREVPDRGCAGNAMRDENVRRKLVSCVDEAACGLEPWLDAGPVCE